MLTYVNATFQVVYFLQINATN